MNENTRKSFLLVLAGLGFYGFGQFLPANASTLSLQVENDSFDGASDAYYTQGIQLTYTPGTPVVWPNKYLPWIFRDRRLRSQYFLGQAIFTPYEIGESQLLEDDRPYAGWLYLGAALMSEKLQPERHLKIVERFEASAGIVGPSSAAERLQRSTHNFIGTYEVNGWDNQLRDEPTLLLSYTRKWAHIRALGNSGIDWEISTSLGGSLGNVTTQLISGWGMRLGRNLYSTVGISGVPPATGASNYGDQTRDFGSYLFVENRQRFIFRDIFLDGNSYKESHSVEKEPRVGEWHFGLAFGTGRYRWTLYHVRRSREFESQYENANFSGLGLTTKF